MPPRFLPGVKQPPAYPLGILGPEDFDPGHFEFVKTKINCNTMWLNNVEILTLGIKVKLNHDTWGGPEEIAKRYARRYWYTVKIYRNLGKFSKMDPEFLKDAKGFIVFESGLSSKFHRTFVRDSKKPFVIYKLPELS